ncbi:hypothetical protein C491_18944 [Natronococcus amylolyticus DSM 10524]|uniref:DUF362 domain-containing protein n=1 Tax=Natronococcus amylolyticus DSM 10524 TaxID=1227497 RepID=L9WZ77_9EURY|nr:DUF362 domain-containing protein [Natronococcus amylolyticus]ELY54707.1 hypothetical protein C491_18944 [Natronococcus amylolyticus DSM 10524]
MSSAHLAAIDEDDSRGGWRPTVDARLARLESAVGAVLEPHRKRLANADRVTLAPDAHYPFHPSTGVVTDPAVVGAVAAWLDRELEIDLVVVGRSDDRIAFERTASYLGYDRLAERFDAALVDLADVPTRNEYRAVDGRSVALSVPKPLLESTVIVVPSLRPTEEGTAAGAVRTLGRLVTSGADSTRAAVAATRTVDPDLAVLDGTVAYGDDPVATNVLLSGSAPAVDAVATSLLGRDVDADVALSLLLSDAERPVAVENPDGVDLSGIRERLAGGRLPPSDDTHPAVSSAYRLYAVASGDAVPPQLEGR